MISDISILNNFAKYFLTKQLIINLNGLKYRQYTQIFYLLKCNIKLILLELKLSIMFLSFWQVGRTLCLYIEVYVYKQVIGTEKLISLLVMTFAKIFKNKSYCMALFILQCRFFSFSSPDSTWGRDMIEFILIDTRLSKHSLVLKQRIIMCYIC